MGIEKIAGAALSTVSQSAAKKQKIGGLVNVLNSVMNNKISVECDEFAHKITAVQNQLEKKFHHPHIDVTKDAREFYLKRLLGRISK